jgi:hypothetical protein
MERRGSEGGRHERVAHLPALGRVPAEGEDINITAAAYVHITLQRGARFVGQFDSEGYWQSRSHAISARVNKGVGRDNVAPRNPNCECRMTGSEHAALTFRSDTRSISIDAAPETVFRFVSDPTNLPSWAVGFCRAIRRAKDSNHWIVTTAQGEMPIRYDTNDSLGTIDFVFSPAPGVEVSAFSRVIANGQGSEYVFTQHQSGGMPDDVFEGQIRALVEELQVLRGLMHARRACSA